ncbi:MAG: ATP-binding protein [Bacilli bacterium]|nr:ATP-binding protein [Bacilli bacterium]
MFEKITYMDEAYIYVALKPGVEIKTNLLSVHVIIEDSEKKVLGEITQIDNGKIKIKLLGEFEGEKLRIGLIRKPLMDATIREINKEEIPLVLGKKDNESLYLGQNPSYNGHPVYLNVNEFFSNHFAIFGNSGAGKSCGVARLIQNVFLNDTAKPYRANFILFDISGEYTQAFKDINQINPNYNYRIFSSNEHEPGAEKLRIPIWLLNSNDIALLLACNSHTQIPMIERMLKLARVFAESGERATQFKDHLIASAIISVLFSDAAPAEKKNDIFGIVAECQTEHFNMEAVIQGVGYTRKFRECFNIDKTGTFTEGILFTEYASSFIRPEFEDYEPQANVRYTLQDLERALKFTLISEGWYKNVQTYADAVTIKVRLHSLITGPYGKLFEYPQYITVEQYLASLLISQGKKYQIININMDDIDDSVAAVITKIFSRIIFDYSKTITNRGSIPFHILIDEAHRYVKKDQDTFLIGYNIFERIAKEGRKYGVLLGIITQRPVELSDTVISQCSNFLIFKINNPLDSEYIRQMVPNINEEVIEKQKTLQSGTCLGFGNAFKIPVIVKLEMPNPSPLSSNSNVIKFWGGGQ